MTQDQTTQPSMYCRQCGYQLAGLSENRCPECGRRFDPQRRRTYDSCSCGRLLRRWMWRVLILLGSIILLIGLLVGGLYWGWRAEQPALAAIRQAGGSVDTNADGPQGLARLARDFCIDYRQLARWSGARKAYDILTKTQIADRAWDVRLYGPREYDALLLQLPDLKRLWNVEMMEGSISEKGMVSIGQIPNLQCLALVAVTFRDRDLVHLRMSKKLLSLSLGGMHITDEGIDHIRHMPQIHRLELTYTATGDAQLAFLKDLPSLERLTLNGNPITAAGLVHLQGMTNLKALYLSYTQIADAGMNVLASLPNLMDLDISGTPVTDAGLKTLCNSRSLQQIIVFETKITSAGIQAAKVAQPRLKVYGP